MTKGRHLPLSNNIGDLRTAFQKLYDAIDQSSSGGSSAKSSGSSGSSGVAVASGSFESPSSTTATLPSTYDLVQRRVVPDTESVALAANQCIVAADYFEVNGVLEATDSTVLVIS